MFLRNLARCPRGSAGAGAGAGAGPANFRRPVVPLAGFVPARPKHTRAPSPNADSATTQTNADAPPLDTDDPVGASATVSAAAATAAKDDTASPTKMPPPQKPPLLSIIVRALFAPDGIRNSDPSSAARQGPDGGAPQEQLLDGAYPPAQHNRVPRTRYSRDEHALPLCAADHPMLHADFQLYPPFVAPLELLHISNKEAPITPSPSPSPPQTYNTTKRQGNIPLRRTKHNHHRSLGSGATATVEAPSSSALHSTLGRRQSRPSRRSKRPPGFLYRNGEDAVTPSPGPSAPANTPKGFWLTSLGMMTAPADILAPSSETQLRQQLYGGLGEPHHKQQQQQVLREPQEDGTQDPLDELAGRLESLFSSLELSSTLRKRRTMMNKHKLRRRRKRQERRS